jgi:hypothetical protein
MATTSSTSPLSSLSSTLRRPFKHISDDMSDTSSADRDELDETEQESLISSLAESNEATNIFYTRLFFAGALIATVPFLWHLVAGGVTSVTFLPALLGLTSLLATAGWVGFVPLDGGGVGGVGQGGKVGTLSDVAHMQASRRRAAYVTVGGQLGVELPFGVPVDVQGPVGRWLPVANGVVGAVLMVFAVLLMDSEAGGQGFWMLLLLPGVLAGVVAVVRGAMRETERGLRELGGLRYDYKGA